MRISRLSIDGFGVFQDVDVRDLPSGLSLFLGANEAGKSTALAFVHTVLFGYADGRTREKVYPPLAGGRPGGRLELETRIAGHLVLERREGKKGGPLLVTRADGRPDGEAVLERLLAGTTRSLYRNLYAFSLTELQALETLTGEEFRDVLYGASLGGTARNIPQARKRLETRMAELFRPGGNKPEINGLFKRLEEVRSGLREAGRNMEEFEEISVELVALESALKAARNDLRDDRSSLEKIGGLVRLWEDWTALQDAEAWLATLPADAGSFPEEGLRSLEALLSRKEAAGNELRGVEDDLQDKKAALDATFFDRSLLERAGEIRALAQSLDSYRRASEEIPRAGEKARAQDEQIQALLVDFGPDWREERVLALDRSAAMRGRIESEAGELEEAAKQVDRAADRVTSQEAAVKEASKECERGDEEVRRLEQEVQEVPWEKLAGLREGRAQFASVLQDIPKRMIERDQARCRLADRLRDIGPEWSPGTLASFDTSLSAQQAVEDMAHCLSAARAAEQEARTALNLAEKTLEDVAEAVAARQEEMDEADRAVDPAVDLRARKDVMRRLGDALARKEVMVGELRSLELLAGPRTAGPSSQQSQASSPRPTNMMAAALMVAAVSACGGLWVAGRPDWAAAAGGGLVLAGLLVFVMGRLVPVAKPVGEDVTASSIRKRRAEVNAQMEETSTGIFALLGKLELDTEPNEAELRGLEDALEAQAAAAEERRRMERDLYGLQEAQKRARAARAKAAAALQQVQQEAREKEEAWAAHAARLNLSSGTSPDTAKLVFAKAQTASSEADAVKAIEKRLEEMELLRSRYLGLMREIPELQEAADKPDGEQVLLMLTDFLAEGDRQQDAQKRLELARADVKKARVRLASEEEKLAAARVEHGEIVAAVQSCRQAWKALLTESGMDGGWSPKTALGLLERAGRLAQLAGVRDEVRAEVRRLTRLREEFERKAAELLESLGRPRPRPEGLSSEVHNLCEALEDQGKRQTRHETLTVDIRNLQVRREQRAVQIQEIEREIRGLLDAEGAADEEAFRRKGRQHEEWNSLRQTVAGCATNMKRISGEADLSRLRESLAGQTLEGLKAHQAGLRERVTVGEAEQDRLQREQATKEERRRQLRSEDAVAGLRAREESLLEEIRVRAREWSWHALALHLLTVAKERFEKEHQPEVIKRAAEFFSRITGGRYTGVFAPHGEEAVEVVNDRGSRLKVEDLSRGTAEQLYLAIRFGYIAGHQAVGEPLPILMDDVLVNFDPERSAQAARGILKMSETHQVLFFTCHPETVNVFRRQADGLPVYAIDGGAISGPRKWPEPPPPFLLLG